MDEDQQDGIWLPSSSERPARLNHPAILLVSCALLISATVGLLAFLISRDSVYKDLYRSRLRLAQTFVAFYEDDTLADRESPEGALAGLLKVWQARDKRFVQSYLCVINHEGEVILNSGGDCSVSTEDGSLSPGGPYEGPTTITDLLAAGQDWVGEMRT